jgi:hypothetical protein
MTLSLLTPIPTHQNDLQPISLHGLETIATTEKSKQTEKSSTKG